MASKLKPPFPWFGGKRQIATTVWRRFGNVTHYVEPFAGGLAVGLACPSWKNLRSETYNDADGLLVNCWRSIVSYPSIVWANTNRPRAELELRSWGRWLREEVDRQQLVERLQADPAFCDPKLAGIWLWGLCAGVSNGFVDLRRSPTVPSSQPNGVLAPRADGYEWMIALANRLARAIILCGDWRRVVTPARLGTSGTVGVFLDPPYAGTENIYVAESSVTADVLAWCKTNGANPQFRIAVCGFDEYRELETLGWQALRWKPTGGHRNRVPPVRRRRIEETIWFSPHCLPVPEASRGD